MKTRPNRTKYFTEIAHAVSKRGTCDRLQVGAIAVRDNRVIMTGYNGAPGWEKNCAEIGHLIKCGHCVRAIHAEQNLIAQCAKNGISLSGTTVYVTHQPCKLCFGLLVSAGVKKIIYNTEYGEVEYGRFAPVEITKRG